MIAQPVTAIVNSKGVEELSEVLTEVMKPWYPTFDRKEWCVWASKYKSFIVCKKCATSMYFRCVAKRKE